MMSEAARSKEINETGINKNTPPRFERDMQEKPHDDGVENKSLSIPKRTTQPSIKPQQLSIPFPNWEAEDLVADYLSRFKKPDMEVLTEREIADKFSDEHLMVLKSKSNNDEPCAANKEEPVRRGPKGGARDPTSDGQVRIVWPIGSDPFRTIRQQYADFVNYIVGKIVLPNWTFEKRKRFFFASQVLLLGSETLEILAHCHSGPTGGYHSANVTAKKVYECGFYWPSVFKDANKYLNELAELRDDAYENTRIYKEWTNKWHDSRLRGDKDFKVNGQRLKKYYGGNIEKEDDEVIEFENGVT
ncbi:hypothetical protein Tco_0793352 [Tanacetum coccineum]